MSIDVNNSYLGKDWISSGLIPWQITLGVTGHRSLIDKAEIAQKIKSVLSKITENIINHCDLKNTPIVFHVLSPLAEGADRLVASEALELTGTSLEAILPMDQNEYLEDFHTPESKQEFEHLLSQAVSVHKIEVGHQADRNEKYASAGRYIVEHCDILIAIWDGESAKSPAGTGSIVSYARDEVKRPLIWINTNNLAAYEPINFEELYRMLRKNQVLSDIEQYNNENVGAERHIQKQNDEIQREQLLSQGDTNSFEFLSPFYTRANDLACKYEKRHHLAETIVFIFAALSVTFAAMQALFWHTLPQLIIVELVLLISIIVLVRQNLHGRWHKKWIDFRSLTERFRSAQFISIVRSDIVPFHPPRYLSHSYSKNDWMVNGFNLIWSRRPEQSNLDLIPLDEQKDFLSESWVQVQINYHADKYNYNKKRQTLFNCASIILFSLTIIVVFLHFLDIMPDCSENFLILFAVSLPAWAASLSAIRMHREYHLNEIRSAEMKRHLEELKTRLINSTDRNTFLDVVREVEETILRETEIWRSIFRFHPPEVSA